MSKNIHLNERLQPQDYILGGSLSVTNRKFRYDTLPHWHNYFEIEVVIRGKGRHIIDGKEYPFKSNTISLLTPVNFHSILVEDKYECETINISFTSEMVSDKMMIYLTSQSVKPFYEPDIETFNRIKNSFELLQYEQHNESEYRYFLLDYCLNLILRNNKIDVLSNVNNEQLSGIRRAILYLELNFREKITLSILSKQAGFNQTYFSEIFHKTTGETYIEKLNSLRIHHAKTLLFKGYSVSEACFASGFGSLSNFLIVFKRKCGMTPSEYRNMYQNN